jgi:hypothetical protein
VAWVVGALSTSKGSWGIPERLLQLNGSKDQ